MALATARWTCTPYSVADAERLAQDLGVSLPLATVLVRRGLDTAEAARRYVAADELYEGRAAAQAGLALARDADPYAVVRAGRDLDLDAARLAGLV